MPRPRPPAPAAPRLAWLPAAPGAEPLPAAVAHWTGQGYVAVRAGGAAPPGALRGIPAAVAGALGTPGDGCAPLLLLHPIEAADWFLCFPHREGEGLTAAEAAWLAELGDPPAVVAVLRAPAARARKRDGRLEVLARHRNTRGGAFKRGLIPPGAADALLAACEEYEWAPVFLMVRFGMHPKDVLALPAERIEEDANGWFLSFRRAKNDNRRREHLTGEQAKRLRAWIASEERVRRSSGLYKLCKRVGARAGFQRVSPMTLRHTACLGFLREHKDRPDCMFLVATRMGCSVEVVRKNYLDLTAWEEARPETQ